MLPLSVNAQPPTLCEYLLGEPDECRTAFNGSKAKGESCGMHWGPGYLDWGSSTSIARLTDEPENLTDEQKERLELWRPLAEQHCGCAISFTCRFERHVGYQIEARYHSFRCEMPMHKVGQLRKGGWLKMTPDC